MATSSTQTTSPDSQLWLSLREQMSGSANDFYIGEATLKQIKEKGLTLEGCLAIAQDKGDPKDYSFHIYSASMAAAVRLLNNESIPVTNKLYCQRDAIVQIIIRPVSDPSPNTSQTPSYANSLRTRKTMSRGKLVPELFVAPQSGHVRGSSDVMSGDEITDPSSMVAIELGKVEKVTLSLEYLLGWIDSRLEDLVNLTEIEVQAIGPAGTTRSFRLTDAIWQQSLIRHAWGPRFRKIWEKYNSADVGRKRALAECAQLQNSAGGNFSQACQNFIHDLRVFGTDKSARNRLDSVHHEFYLGQPYFVPAVVNKILSIPTMGGTLQDDLRKLATKKAMSGTDMCAAHDLAPLYGSVLIVRWEKENKKAVASHQYLPQLQQMPQGPQQVDQNKGKGKASSSKWNTNTIKEKLRRKDDKDGKGGKGGKGGKDGAGGTSESLSTGFGAW